VKVVLNSDITFLPDLIREGLGRQVSALAEACREHKFDLALPLTTVMEFQRQQEEYAEQERRKLDDATALLDRLGVPHDPVDSATLIEIRALSDLFSEAGSSVEVVNPTFEDFMEAHRRACLHLSPQPRTGKGGPDEMRDLVVWCLAVRISREQGGAMLISKDKIHTGELGREEAEAVGLVVVSSVDDALKFFRIETPDARLFQDMLEPVWGELPGLGIGVTKDMSVLEVRDARFVQGPTGRPVAASARVRVSLEGSGEKVVSLRLQTRPDGSVALGLGDCDARSSDALGAGIIEELPGQTITADYTAKLGRLRALLEE
jgi:hypothetical protein